MKEGLYLRNKKEVFKECGLNSKDRKHNCHHIFERSDLKYGYLPPDFPINDKQFLIPLVVREHNELHELMDNHPYFKRNMNTRVYLANMSFIGELQDVPDRLYFTDPMDMIRK